MKKNLLIYFICFAMFSCSTVEVITIQVEKPAQITVPSEIKVITVVNNAVPQSDTVGHYTTNNEKPLKIPNDSTTIILTQALAQFMDEENHFELVQSYDKPIRKDNLYSLETIIDPAEINMIAKLTNADAILSVDRFLTTSTIQNYNL